MSTTTLYPAGPGAAADIGAWYKESLMYAPPLQVWKESSFRIGLLEVYGRINSITWEMDARITHGTNLCVRPTIIANGQYAFGSDTYITVPDQTYSLSYTWYSNPITGMAWTFQDICDLQIGIRIYKELSETSTFYGSMPHIVVDYTPLGVTQLIILRPNGPGDASECVPVGRTYNYQCVNEETPDDDASYVRTGSSSLSEYKDLYAFSDVAYIPNIQYVAEYIRVSKRSKDHDWYYHALIKTHGSEYRGPYVSMFSETWRYLHYVLTKNPYTGNNWTVDEVNSLQAGQILKGWATDNPRCSQVYVSVLGVKFTGRPRVQIVGPIF